MTRIAFYDTETNGLLRQATKMHCLAILMDGEWWSCADQPEYDGRVVDITLPNGNVLKGVHQVPMKEGLRRLEEADLRVAHNGLDFDERVTRRLFPWWQPKGRFLDTLIMWQLIYPSIYQDGPNTHKCPGHLKMRYSLEAIGYRLGEKKNKDFDPGDWQTWSQEMQDYMLQDVVVLEKAFKWAMFQKPSMRAVELEHKFSAIMRRQEAWGFTFDHDKALQLQADLQATIGRLEVELIEAFGEWWEPGNLVRVGSTRRVKMAQFPDVTMPREGKNGKALKPYVGPPLCVYEEGAMYTPIERVQFNPNSREHVRKMLFQRYGWKPTRFTKKAKTAQVDDEVLRALPYPEAQSIAEYFTYQKVAGYVSSGKKAWLLVAQEEGSEFRMHGRVNSVAGTYTFRVSCTDPNAANIPSRHPVLGPACRDLFKASEGFELIGGDGSGVQLRGLAHYLARGGKLKDGREWGDKGAYAGVFIRGEDPHEFMRDTIGTDLMGEGHAGRAKGKTFNYAACFGAGDKRAGSVIEPFATDARKTELGGVMKARLFPVFGTAFDDLKLALKERWEETRCIVGLDGRKAYPPSAHTCLSTLLQMFEAVVIKTAIVLLDERLQELGLNPGVDLAGYVHRIDADYECCAHVYDELQADVRPEHREVYSETMRWAIPEAGRRLGVRCPLQADVKAGASWLHTH